MDGSSRGISIGAIVVSYKLWGWDAPTAAWEGCVGYVVLSTVGAKRNVAMENGRGVLLPAEGSKQGEKKVELKYKAFLAVFGTMTGCTGEFQQQQKVVGGVGIAKDYGIRTYKKK